MKPDSRLEDVLHTLSDPEEYVRGILASFDICGFNRDEAAIRIGVSGTGVFPNYCIEEGLEQVTLPRFNISGTCYRRREVFNGRSHRTILDDKFKGTKWSLAPQTFLEVQKTVAILRASRKMH